LLAFAGSGWAFRERERAAVRPWIEDVLAQAMAGARDARVEIALAAFPSEPARMRASLIGRPETLGPIGAALINGIAAGEGARMAAPVVCAALAAGEASGAHGAAVLDAIVAGLEVALRVEAAMSDHTERGWDPKGTCGRLGASIAAARAFGLQRSAVRNAFGLAATAAGGLTDAIGTMTSAYVIGSAAADGVEAALLARAEFTSASGALEGRRGFAALMAGAFDAERVVADIGERFVFTDGAAYEANDTLPGAVRHALAELERAPSVAALLAATRA
jgi:2-methylcitrate dehydratase PrpD